METPTELTLGEFVDKLKLENPVAEKVGKTPLTGRIKVPTGVQVFRSELSNQGTYDELFFDLELVVPKAKIVGDRALMRELYELGSSAGDVETVLSVDLTLDEFRTAKLPIENALGLAAGRIARVFKGQTERNPLGTVATEEIALTYVQPEEGLVAIGVRGAQVFTETIDKMVKELGLDKVDVILTAPDYRKLSQKLPAQFYLRGYGPKELITVPMTLAEIKQVEEVLGKPIPYDDLTEEHTLEQYLTRFDQAMTPRSHINLLHREFDLEVDPKAALELVIKGFEILQNANLDRSVIESVPKIDQFQLLGFWQSVLLQFADDPKKGTEFLAQYMNILDKDGKYMRQASKFADPAYIVKTQDAETMCRWWHAFMKERGKTEVNPVPMKIHYLGGNVPAANFPTVGEINEIEVKAYPDSTWVQNDRVYNAFLVDSHGVPMPDNSENQIVVLRVHLNDPQLIAAQNKLLGSLGVYFQDLPQK